MEAEGLAFQYAKRLTKSTIEHILKNPIYYGDFLWNGKLYHGSHLAIISRDLWDQTQEAFRKTNRPKQTKREFPFIGMLTCAFCGCAITAELKKGKYIYYHCTGNHGACMKPTVGSVSPTTITLTTAPKLRGWVMPWWWSTRPSMQVRGGDPGPSGRWLGTSSPTICWRKG